MPELNWIGKDAVVNHHKEVPFRLLKKIKSASVGENSQNLIIHGDNLEGLKALMPHYHGKIKCVYIDPPYNTGNEKWLYNDKVNSPKINNWFGKVVGKESEDLCRHDKWLCMMYPRLKLLRDLLSEDGSIFISIDDNECHYLKALMDEIFSRENFIANIIWQKKPFPQNDARWLSDNHDHIILYAKNKKIWRPNRLPRTEASDKRYKNPDDDHRGPWMRVPLTAKTYSPKTDYPITTPSGNEFLPGPGLCWRHTKERYEELVVDNRIYFGKDGSGRPIKKSFLREKKGLVSKTIWLGEEVNFNAAARTEIKNIFNNEGESIFNTPKPTKLIDRIVRLSTNGGDIVLDSFAGSGTTAQSVMNLNKEDGGGGAAIDGLFSSKWKMKSPEKSLQNVSSV